MELDAKRLVACLCLLLVSGCIAPPAYSAFRESRPRSILVLPPLNESTDVSATYSWLTTATAPIAELWSWRRSSVDGSGGSGNLLVDVIVAAIEQVADTVGDKTHPVARTLNFQLFQDENTGLPYGPYHPKHETDPRLN